jgi:hypothetical protein
MVSLQGVKDLSLQDTSFKNDSQAMTAQAQYFVQYYATLYNRQMNKTGGFYGRTYSSQLKPLVASATNSGMMEIRDEEFLFFHTNYVEKLSVLVVEIVVVRQ